MKTVRQFILIGAVLGFTGVALGAFGAHGLESILVENGREGTFQTASEYQMVHALALLAVAWMLSSGKFAPKLLTRAGYFFVAGTVIFSGSLYILAILDLRFMGAIAPIGGACLLVGWGLLGYAGWTMDVKD